MRVCVFFREWMCACRTVCHRLSQHVERGNVSIGLCHCVVRSEALTPQFNFVLASVWTGFSVDELKLFRCHISRLKKCWKEADVTLRLCSMLEVQLLCYISLTGFEYFKNICVASWINWTLNTWKHSYVYDNLLFPAGIFRLNQWIVFHWLRKCNYSEKYDYVHRKTYLSAFIHLCKVNNSLFRKITVT